MLFLFVLMTLIIASTLMYNFEGPPAFVYDEIRRQYPRPDGTHTPFETIFTTMWWCVVTMTTVGYGDYVPQTALGRLLASVVMMLGFGIIAIPTGILTYSGVRQQRQESMASQCPACGRSGHRNDAVHCDRCGALLRDHKASSV